MSSSEGGANMRVAVAITLRHCLIYSIGSNGDYSFEEGLVNTVGKICEIHIFDPGNYEKPGLAANNMYYHPWGLTSSDPTYRVERENFYSIQEIQKMLGHENRVIDIFKIDCEGCEW
jgi:Methyltransferase domain